MLHRTLLLLALLGVGTFGLTACPGQGGDDDDAVGDDGDATGDDDDATGDDDDATGDDDDAAGDFDILGIFDDGFQTHAVTDHAWISWSSDSLARYDISELDLENQVLVAQNSDLNQYNPGLWSRFQWTGADGQGWFCQDVFDAADEQSARNAPAADPGDLDAGCSGFPWSMASPDAAAVAIAGVHVDEWGADNMVTSETWVVTQGEDVAKFDITQFNNDQGWLVAQNGPDNSFNADLWSRFDYTEYQGSWYACTAAFDAATEQDAVNAPASDPTDPTAGGCGGQFPWTNLTP